MPKVKKSKAVSATRSAAQKLAWARRRRVKTKEIKPAPTEQLPITEMVVDATAQTKLPDPPIASLTDVLMRRTNALRGEVSDLRTSVAGIGRSAVVVHEKLHALAHDNSLSVSTRLALYHVLDKFGAVQFEVNKALSLRSNV